MINFRYILYELLVYRFAKLIFCINGLPINEDSLFIFGLRSPMLIFQDCLQLLISVTTLYDFFFKNMSLSESPSICVRSYM